ncbi:lanC-like protein 2, partial [Aphis craccivora]
MMEDKKKTNEQKHEHIRNYKNELSLLSDEKANEVVGRSLKIMYKIIFIIDKTKEKIHSIPGLKGATLTTKLNELSNKNEGLKILRKINSILLGENVQLEDLYQDPIILSYFNYAPITSVDVERLHSFTEEKLEMHMIIHFNNKLNSLKTSNIFQCKINEYVEAHMFVIDDEVQRFLEKPKPNDDELTVESIYFGMAGVALLYKLFANRTHNRDKTIEAKLIIEKCISILDKNSDSVSYLTGKSGIFVTAAEIYRDLGDIENAKKMIKKVLDLLPLALNKKLPDILLYGRAGYLYSLLLLKKLGWEDPDRDRLIRKVVSAILHNGIKTCENDKPKKTTLMYKCHNKKYLGAAQGLSGVLQCLLLANTYLTKHELNNIVKPALDYLLTLRYTSGNLPSSMCNDPDHLVQWCQGAPGALHTYALAYNKYFDAAVELNDVVWKRGLLTKGYGLCHGVSGNSYAFLTLFQLTGKAKYLYRTARFVDWCLTTGRQRKVPDNLYSLFEGILASVL